MKSVLIMSLPARTINKTPLKYLHVAKERQSEMRVLGSNQHLRRKLSTPGKNDISKQGLYVSIIEWYRIKSNGIVSIQLKSNQIRSYRVQNKFN